MPHQDRSHDAINVAEIQAALARVVPASLAEFRRHGNALIPADTLVAVAMLTWGWLCGGTIDERLAAPFAILKQVGRSTISASRQGVMQALATCAPALLPQVRMALVDLVKGLKGLAGIAAYLCALPQEVGFRCH